jgi:hypothetical protein
VHGKQVTQINTLHTYLNLKMSATNKPKNPRRRKAGRSGAQTGTQGAAGEHAIELPCSPPGKALASEPRREAEAYRRSYTKDALNRIREQMHMRADDRRLDLGYNCLPVEALFISYDRNRLQIKEEDVVIEAIDESCPDTDETKPTTLSEFWTAVVAVNPHSLPEKSKANLTKKTVLTTHAGRRSQQRNITREEIRKAMSCGKRSKAGRSGAQTGTQGAAGEHAMELPCSPPGKALASEPRREAEAYRRSYTKDALNRIREQMHMRADDRRLDLGYNCLPVEALFISYDRNRLQIKEEDVVIEAIDESCPDTDETKPTTLSEFWTAVVAVNPHSLPEKSKADLTKKTVLTTHAGRRSQQRNITREEMRKAMSCGKRSSQSKSVEKYIDVEDGVVCIVHKRTKEVITCYREHPGHGLAMAHAFVYVREMEHAGSLRRSVLCDIERKSGAQVYVTECRGCEETYISGTTWDSVVAAGTYMDNIMNPSSRVGGYTTLEESHTEVPFDYEKDDYTCIQYKDYLQMFFGVEYCIYDDRKKMFTLRGSEGPVRVMARHIKRVAAREIEAIPSTWVECADEHVQSLLDMDYGINYCGYIRRRKKNSMEEIIEDSHVCTITSAWSEKKKGFYIFSFYPAHRFAAQTLLDTFIRKHQPPIVKI